MPQMRGRSAGSCRLKINEMKIAGTGHRPKWMPCKYNEQHPWAIKIKKNLREELEKVQPEIVITGMAIGWDTWLAEIAINLHIPIHCYIPFQGQGDNWPNKARQRYGRILNRAEKIVYTQNEYTKDCFFKRDKTMIDDCDMVFALLNPDTNSGGTYYTVNYALKDNKVVKNFWI